MSLEPKKPDIINPQATSTLKGSVDKMTDKDFTFDESLKELERIIRELESGQKPLEEAIILYEKGFFFKQNCLEKLKAAQLTIDQIRQASENNPQGFLSAERLTELV
jgi:exodeoxyribonuclease VII small subunit